MSSLNNLQLDKFFQNLDRLNSGLENLNTSVKKVEGTFGTGDPIIPELHLSENRKNIYIRDTSPEPLNTYGSNEKRLSWELAKMIPFFGKIFSGGEFLAKGYDYFQPKEKKLIQDPYNPFESDKTFNLGWTATKFVAGNLPNNAFNFGSVTGMNLLEYALREDKRKMLELNRRSYLKPVYEEPQISGDKLGNTVDPLKFFLNEHSNKYNLNFGNSLLDPFGLYKSYNTNQQIEQKNDIIQPRKGQKVRSFEEQEEEKKKEEQNKIDWNKSYEYKIEFHSAERDATDVKHGYGQCSGQKGSNNEDVSNFGGYANHNPNREHADNSTRTKGPNPVEVFQKSFAEAQKIGGALKTIMGTLNIGSHTFVGGLINGFNDALGVVQAVVETIKALQTINTVLSFLPFASGGSVPGFGDTDSVPAVLTPGEFVVKKSVVNKFGSGFFEWINGGGLTNSLAGHYAGGGIVNGGGSLQVEFAPIEFVLRGDKLYGAINRYKSNSLNKRRF